MLIEMKQELSWRNDSMMKMNVIYNGQEIGSFVTPYITKGERRNTGIFQFRGSYTGECTYDIQMNLMPCPADYSENMFAYRKKDAATGVKYTMTKMAYDIVSNGQLAARLFGVSEDYLKKWFLSPSKVVDYDVLQVGNDVYQC